jgi:putative hydrolase of the HAD superfamily
VAARYSFSRETIAAGWNVFSRLEVDRKLKGYGDLPLLSDLSPKRFLVTSRFRRLQESKIKALQLAALFTAVYVDAKEQDRLGKIGYFERILRDYGLAATEVLVVGDNGDSEVAIGAHLGLRTVQTLRPGVPYAAIATFHVGSLHELKQLLSQLDHR